MIEDIKEILKSIPVVLVATLAWCFTVAAVCGIVYLVVRLVEVFL